MGTFWNFVKQHMWAFEIVIGLFLIVFIHLLAKHFVRIVKNRGKSDVIWKKKYRNVLTFFNLMR